MEKILYREGFTAEELLGVTAGGLGGTFPPPAFLLFSYRVPFPLGSRLPHLKIRLHPFELNSIGVLLTKPVHLLRFKTKLRLPFLGGRKPVEPFLLPGGFLQPNICFL